jgi:hypothetical protein
MHCLYVVLIYGLFTFDQGTDVLKTFYLVATVKIVSQCESRMVLSFFLFSVDNMLLETAVTFFICCFMLLISIIHNF